MSSLLNLKELQDTAIVFAMFVVAPAFLIYRAITAPFTSGVFVIIYLTCAASSYFLLQCGFPNTPCLRTDVRGFDCLFGELFTCLGAFLCLFPKWQGES